MADQNNNPFEKPYKRKPFAGRLLLIAVGILIFCAIYYIAYLPNANAPINLSSSQQNLTVSESTSEAESADLKTYRNEARGLVLEYPSEWIVYEEQSYIEFYDKKYESRGLEWPRLSLDFNTYFSDYEKSRIVSANQFVYSKDKETVNMISLETLSGTIHATCSLNDQELINICNKIIASIQHF